MKKYEELRQSEEAQEMIKALKIEKSKQKFLNQINEGQEVKTRYENEYIYKTDKNKLLDITDFFNKIREPKLFGILMELNDVVAQNARKELVSSDIHKLKIGTFKKLKSHYKDYFLDLLNKIKSNVVNDIIDCMKDFDVSTLRSKFREILDVDIDPLYLPSIILKVDDGMDIKKFGCDFSDIYSKCKNKNHNTVCMKIANHIICIDIRIIKDNLKITCVDDSIKDSEPFNIDICKCIEKVVREQNNTVKNAGYIVSVPPFNLDSDTYFSDCENGSAGYNFTCFTSAALQSAIMEKMSDDVYEELTANKMFLNAEGKRFKFEDVKSKKTTNNQIDKDNVKKTETLIAPVDDKNIMLGDKYSLRIKTEKNKNKQLLNFQLKQPNNFVLPKIVNNKHNKMKNNNDKQVKISKRDCINKINGTIKGGLLTKHITRNDINRISKQVETLIMANGSKYFKNDMEKKI